MSHTQLGYPIFTMPYPADIGEDETLMDYALRKAREVEEQREQIAQLKDGVRVIFSNVHDSEKVIDTCSNLLVEV
ncbi:hypothetical protein DI392_00935 [Vibrio albus]|uniref:Uncharacterized protein n=1 Tax=Vibrio albus TaxID=2200953 RepID=A0A2U3BDJ7_9VIBR|nr:hypothetical protein [Vibrio albus]PWI34878.1 hypothetical protein DI392_00935 [Vibrio albus]